MNTYAVKSSAHRAAKQAGLSKEEYTVIEVDGGFAYEVIINDTPVIAEFTRCPHCAVHLSNGVSEHGQDVNGKPYLHKAFIYQCLGCGGEFGPAIPEPEVKGPWSTPKAKAPREVTHVSTAERPTKLVWHIADEMILANPDARRKEVIAECVRRGIAFYTARTQYQQWLAVFKGTAK